jgi:uncharacterized protein YbjT (DUF2867 family)
MQGHNKIAVVGATGRVGRHTIDVLNARGHDTVAISRAQGIDIITGRGLAEALAGVESVIDVATGPSPDQEAATKFFTTATRNLQEAGARAGVRQIVVISIIGIDRFSAGYMAAKLAHERAMSAGPVPVRILRAAQFHEFVGAIMQWGRQGDVTYVPNRLSQLVAAKNVAEALADLATQAPPPAGTKPPISEIGGPRPENLVEMAAKLAARRGDRVRIEPAGPDREIYQGVSDVDALLPGPHATLVGPTFEQWLSSRDFEEWLASQ